MNAKALSPVVVFLVIFLAVGSIFRLAAPPRRPAPLDRRFSSMARAWSDLLWVKAAGRIPYLLRVPTREAEEHYRRMRIAARLNPANLEIYRYGTLGLNLWGRNDLALALISEGLERHPDDAAMKSMLYTTITLGPSTAPESALSALRRMTQSTEPAESVMRFLLMLQAQQEERMGRIDEAVATWRRLEASLAEGEGLRARAAIEIDRLTEAPPR